MIPQQEGITLNLAGFIRSYVHFSPQTASRHALLILLSAFQAGSCSCTASERRHEGRSNIFLFANCTCNYNIALWEQWQKTPANPAEFCRPVLSEIQPCFSFQQQINWRWPFHATDLLGVSRLVSSFIFVWLRTKRFGWNKENPPVCSIDAPVICCCLAASPRCLLFLSPCVKVSAWWSLCILKAITLCPSLWGAVNQSTMLSLQSSLSGCIENADIRLNSG